MNNSSRTSKKTSESNASLVQCRGMDRFSLDVQDKWTLLKYKLAIVTQNKYEILWIWKWYMNLLKKSQYYCGLLCSDTHPPLSLTPLQDSYYIWTSVDYPCRFGVRSDPDGLFSWTEELKSQVIGVRDLLEAWHSSDTHPSLFHTLTRLILHLNQCWLSL